MELRSGQSKHFLQRLNRIFHKYNDESLIVILSNSEHFTEKTMLGHRKCRIKLFGTISASNYFSRTSFTKLSYARKIFLF